jgi:hypothetical protein
MTNSSIPCIKTGGEGLKYIKKQQLVSSLSCLFRGATTKRTKRARGSSNTLLVRRKSRRTRSKNIRNSLERGESKLSGEFSTLNLTEEESSSNASPTRSSPLPKTVKFDKVSIRCFNMTISDNPSCSSGIPVGLSWEFDPTQIEMPIESFELSRVGKRRYKRDLRIPAQDRNDLLNAFNVSLKEAIQVINQVEMTKGCRIKSVQKQRRNIIGGIIKTVNKGFHQVVGLQKRKKKRRDKSMTPSSNGSIVGSLHRCGSLSSRITN